MRKLIIATALAAMVFSVGAFASSFQVEQVVLASGEGVVTSCGDWDVRSWGSEVGENNAQADPEFVQSITFDDLGGCTTDQVVFIELFDDEGNREYYSGEHRLTAAEITNDRISITRTAIAEIDAIEIVVHTKKA